MGKDPEKRVSLSPDFSTALIERSLFELVAHLADGDADGDKPSADEVKEIAASILREHIARIWLFHDVLSQPGGLAVDIPGTPALAAHMSSDGRLTIRLRKP